MNNNTFKNNENVVEGKMANRNDRIMKRINNGRAQVNNKLLQEEQEKIKEREKFQQRVNEFEKGLNKQN